jgi:hypothetical protein
MGISRLITSPNWLANVDWAFHIFWLIYFSIVLGIVAYVID